MWFNFQEHTKTELSSCGKQQEFLLAKLATSFIKSHLTLQSKLLNK